MNDFSRPREGFKFQFHGMKLNSRPDNLKPGKYPIAVNVRGYRESNVQTRPGITPLFACGTLNSYATDLRAYSALFSDNRPRILTRNFDDTIWLDTGVQVGALAGGGGPLGTASPGAFLIPFRPNQSATPFMYIANGRDYQKFSAPDVSNVVIQQKVGIAEPQAAPNAVIVTPITSFLPNSPPWTPSGTAGAVGTSARVSDTIAGTFFDPYLAGLSIGWQVLQVSSAIQYQAGMEIDIGATPTKAFVEDVFPALVTSLTIANIYYLSGITGRCYITIGAPTAGGIAEGNLSGGRVPQRTAPGTGSSIYNSPPTFQLRRGSLITLSGGAETVMVLSVTEGTSNSVTIETVTVNNHIAGETITGKQGIAVAMNASFTNGTAIVTNQATSAVTTGIGQISASLPGGFFSPGNIPFSPTDYFHISVNIDTLVNLTEMKILIDIGDGTFAGNYLYFTVRPSDLSAAIANAQTQLATLATLVQREITDSLRGTAAENQETTFLSLQTSSGASQWSEISFNLSDFTRVGNDQTKTLDNANAIRILFNASGTINVKVGSINVNGGGSPDVGTIGAPYRYRVRGRSSVTGVTSNPSPATRYGVTARARGVFVYLAANGVVPNVYDSQIDTWDIFRYGGSVTSWRYVGSIPATYSNAFEDNIDDAAAGAGRELEFDNFEPWPSIALPISLNTIAISNPWGGVVAKFNVPNSALNYVASLLPGTLVTVQLQWGGPPALGSSAAFVLTLRSRPTLVTGNIWQFEFEESAGTIGTNYVGTQVNIYEPAVARQGLPYMWGPDANGTVFAVGDPLRPGTLYFAKNNNPDSAPDSYNIEITPPTEPLLGGETIDGLSFVGSTERWWALYPTPDNPTQRYNFVQQPFTRGLAAPFGHCNDGKSLYWWAKDGIQSSSQGSLTDADLYDLFPHEGAQGRNITYAGVTAFAPDYSQILQFRLAHANGFLYAMYPYVGGAGKYAMLVLDLHTMGWSIDTYANSFTIYNIYKVEQQEASFLTSISPPVVNPIILLAGTTDATHGTGKIYKQSTNTNDDTTPISCKLATFEFDGGDIRATKQWGDLFLDLVPAAPAGVTATPVSLGVGVAPPTAVPSSSSRVRTPISVGGIVVSDFMGLLLSWTDDFSAQTIPTDVKAWQPSFDIQPPAAIGWKTFASSFGLQGYGHIRQIAIAWVSTAPITLTLTTFDGLDPAPITIPSSGGLYQKQMFPMNTNKGQLFTFQATSAAPFQIFEDDCEIHVGAWAREGGYAILKSFGGQQDAQSPV